MHVRRGRRRPAAVPVPADSARGVQEEQQRCQKLHHENSKLKAALRPRNDPTIVPVERLKGDYQNRTDTMDDDLAFIQEVMAGASTAIPEFNAELVRRKCPRAPHSATPRSARCMQLLRACARALFGSSQAACVLNAHALCCISSAHAMLPADSAVIGGDCGLVSSAMSHVLLR
jgi:hypothetical protein